MRGVGCGMRIWTRDKQEQAKGNSMTNTLHPSERLSQFKEMRNGWLDGIGTAPDHSDLDWLSGQFALHYSDDAPLPYTYPTESGGVQMEWSIKNHEMVLEIDLKSHTGEWLWLEQDSDDHRERQLNLDTNADWKWLNNEVIRRHNPDG